MIARGPLAPLDITVGSPELAPSEWVVDCSRGLAPLNSDEMICETNSALVAIGVTLTFGCRPKQADDHR